MKDIETKWMKRLTYTLFLSICIALTTQSQSNNTDLTCVKQVFTNAGTASGLEASYKVSLDSVKGHHSKSAEAMETIQMVATLHHLAKQNLESFGSESRAYKTMVKLTADIASELINIGNNSLNKPGNIAASTKVIGRLTGEMHSLVDNMIYIAMGGKATNPFGSSSKNDGKNLLDAGQRICVCDQTIAGLQRMLFSLRCLNIRLECLTLQQLMMEVAPLDFYYISDGKRIATNIINQFK